MAVEHIVRKAVLEIMQAHPGIRAYEIAEKLDINTRAAEGHVREIRAEWKGKE